MRRFRKVAVIVAAAATVGVMGLGPAMAAGSAPPKATGTVQLAPMQWASFSAFPATTSSPVKGWVTYTNFASAATSGVYRLATTVPIVFVFGDTYPHTLTITSEKMLGFNSLAFAGNGVLDADHSFTFDATGTIVGDQISMQVVYTGVGAGNTWNLVGTISTDGSMAGTATSPTLSSDPGTWSSPVGTAYSVLSYTVPVTCASVSGDNATFGFNAPQLGLPIVVAIHDGGTPGTNGDTWAHGVDAAPGSCTGATGGQTIIGGNLVVH